MDTRPSCCNSGNRDLGGYRRRCYIKSDYNRFEPITVLVNRSKRLKWRMLWRKILKEKKKVFGCRNVSVVHVPYDPYTYSMNFDQGSVWADPDNHSRTFSARFAVPSRIFHGDGLMS